MNDATDIAAVLSLDCPGMPKSIGKFSEKLNDTDVAVFYYAGRALQVNGNSMIMLNSK